MTDRKFDLETSHDMEALPGGIEELSAMMSVMDDENRCPHCSCHAVLHMAHVERVDGEPVLVSTACMACAIRRNIHMSTCYVSPQKIVDATPAGELQPMKTLEPDDLDSLAGMTRIFATFVGVPYAPVKAPKDE